jgi:hypothetical protein
VHGRNSHEDPCGLHLTAFILAVIVVRTHSGLDHCLYLWLDCCSYSANRNHCAMRMLHDFYPILCAEATLILIEQRCHSTAEQSAGRIWISKALHRELQKPLTRSLTSAHEPTVSTDMTGPKISCVTAASVALVCSSTVGPIHVPGDLLAYSTHNNSSSSSSSNGSVSASDSDSRLSTLYGAR